MQGTQGIFYRLYPFVLPSFPFSFFSHSGKSTTRKVVKCSCFGSIFDLDLYTDVNYKCITLFESILVQPLFCFYISIISHARLCTLCSIHVSVMLSKYYFSLISLILLIALRCCQSCRVIRTNKSLVVVHRDGKSALFAIFHSFSVEIPRDEKHSRSTPS